MAVRTTRKAVSSEDYDENYDAQGDYVPDIEPARTTKRVTRTSGPISTGWGAPKQEQRETEKAPYLKVDRTKRIIKLLDEEPTVRYKSHYLNTVRKFFTCIEVFNGKGDEDNVDCPLCDAGNRPGAKFIMNVIEMEENVTDYVVKTWTFGPEVAGQLQEFAQESPTSPLNKESLYFQVYQVKTENGRTSNKVVPLRSAYLAEEYGVEPFNADELAAFDKRYGESVVWITSLDKMIEAAKTL